MKGVERTNIVIVHPNQRAGFTPCNPYIMDVNRGNWNCYSYRGFEHLARNCRNKGTKNRIGKEIRLEYGQNNEQSNLNGNRDLIVLN